MQTALPSVEGLTPVILWYTFVGIVGIGGLIVLWGKVVDVFQKHKARKEDDAARKDGTIQGQLKEINKRLDVIDEYIKESDKKFDRDKQRLDNLDTSVNRIEKGINALARAELAHIQHDLTGNHTDNLGKAETEITDYLTGKEGEKK